MDPLEELARCDREILRHKAEACDPNHPWNTHPGGSMLGLHDWFYERKLIMQDIVKKELDGFVADALRTDADYPAALQRLQENPDLLPLWHAASGLCTEIGEFMDILKKVIFYGRELDRVHAVEELGDITWYERIAVSRLQVRYADILERNMAKLHQRYPDRFTTERAENRDLHAERLALEGSDAQ